MFRILPYLIIILFVSIALRAVDFFYELPKMVYELRAAEEKKEDKPKKNDKKAPKEKVDEEKEADILSDKEEDVPTNILYTDIETQVLQSLADRREELEQRENDISLKEASLVVIEKNIDRKVDELKLLQRDLSKIMEQYQTKENEKIMSLVKVYESMKPIEAAKIFEQLQMSILIEVADNMKEAKLGQILAKMDAYKAKEITVELASRRRIKR